MNNIKYILAVLLTCSLMPSAFAVSDEDLQTIKNAPTEQCQFVLTPAFDKEVAEFQQFLNEHFLNKSSASSLAEGAVARYGEYRKNVRYLFSFVEVASTSQNTALQSYLNCESLRDEYLKAGKELLLEHVGANASQKQTAVMLEKYQTINSKLRSMQLESAKMYGYFMTFNNKLPGFLRRCLVR